MLPTQSRIINIIENNFDLKQQRNKRKKNRTVFISILSHNAHSTLVILCSLDFELKSNEMRIRINKKKT